MNEEKIDVIETEHDEVIVEEVNEEPVKDGFLSRVKGGAKKHWKKILVGSVVAVGLVALGKKKNSDTGYDEISYDDPELEALIASEDSTEEVDVTDF